ncbi:MAG: hypothetical protein D6699_05950 [Aquificota bacterium]|nr:MAG: hypothetical protein D6699_05950 [Aquificota bacterium]
MSLRKREFSKYGIHIEDRYLIQETEGKKVVVPYYHIRTLEYRENRIILYTGGIERIVIELPPEVCEQLYEELLIHIERVYL